MATENFSTKCPHTYGAGTRLSSYYTMGRDGLPCPGHAGPRGSEARKAHARGKADRIALAKAQS